jgi:hypothetical protein
MSEENAWVANFYAHGFEFELFAQQKPTSQQTAYKHLVVEYQLLEIGGQQAREPIRELKQQGLKTEPAFARYFDIQHDDPFEALLDLSKLDYAELQKMFTQHEG